MQTMLGATKLVFSSNCGGVYQCCQVSSDLNEALIWCTEAAKAS